MNFFFKTMASPIGILKLVSTDHALSAILWENDNPARVPLGSLREHKNQPLLLQAQQQLEDYFAGIRREFTIPLEFHGTYFQKSVWMALTRIPFGETRTYSQIAAEIGNPKAVRAVGAANGKNPISIIAPCHRIIGADGSLTGFAGGLDTKAFLLDLESRLSKPAQLPCDLKI